MFLILIFLISWCSTLLPIHYLTAEQYQDLVRNAPNINIIHVNNSSKNLTTISNKAKSKPTCTTPTNPLLQEKVPLPAGFAWLPSNLLAHKKKLFFGTCLTLYAGINIWLWTLYYKVNYQTSWTQWKNENPLEELSSQDQHYLTQELINAIQGKYPHQESFIEPIMAFITECNKELTILRTFIYYYAFLKKYKFTLLLPNYDKTYFKAQENIIRLIYLQNLIKQWLSKYS